MGKRADVTCGVNEQIMSDVSQPLDKVRIEGQEHSSGFPALPSEDDLGKV